MKIFPFSLPSPDNVLNPASWLVRLPRRTGLAQKRCACCLEPFTPFDDLALCPGCRALLPRRLTGYCPACGGITAPYDAAPALCGTCLVETPPWTAFRCYGVFEGQMREVLHRAKYQADMGCLAILGKLMILACSDLPRPDAVVPMPLHPARLRERGYNQCREIAVPLAAFLNVRVRHDLLVRERPTRPQTGMPRKERLENLKGVFRASPKAAGLHILLIDDTSTTGTSLKSAATALLAGGAARVDAAVVAHASLHTVEVPGNVFGTGQ